MPDDTVETSSRRQAKFGDLGGFAGAGLAGYDNHRVPADGLNDLILFGGYRQLCIVAEFRQVFLPQGSFALRCFEASFKLLEPCTGPADRKPFGLPIASRLAFLRVRSSISARAAMRSTASTRGKSDFNSLIFLSNFSNF